MNSRTLLFALLGIASIWIAVAGVLRITSQHTSTPDKVMASMLNAPWLKNENAEVSDAERQKQLDAVIAQVNLLDFDQRKQLREDGQDVTRRFMESLTKEEKGQFLEKTVEQHFKSVMKAFNQMKPEERRRMVEQARADMQRNQPDGRNMENLKKEDEKVFQNVVEKGLGAYYEDASAETKLDLAPLMEEMQQRMRTMGRR